MYGWTGTILRVDLTHGTVRRERTDRELAHDYIGARGMGGRIIADEVDPQADPLGPENKMVFAPGPFTGTFAPSGGRYNVITKSPLNNTIAASNSGGTFGPELKYAGYDAVIVEGRSRTPVYLWIRDDEVVIRDASAFWGMNVHDAVDAMRAETDEDAKVACIGPAGENLSLIASVMNEMHRAAGRTGVGAVMGSKKLKAIVVVGTGPVTVADPDRFKSAVLSCTGKIKANPVGGAGLKAYGTNVLVNILNEVGALPTRNFQDGHFPNADKTGGESLAANQLVRPKGCYACVISCGRVTKTDNPLYPGMGEGPEYETAWGFGADSGVDNLDAIVKANYLCNEYGLDTISMSATIACAMELYERGYLTKEDTDGLDLVFGNAQAMVEAVRKTGTGEGFGKRLAEGSYRLAESVGHPELSMTTKKQEMPAYDPRGVQGIGLNYATGNRGGCHVRGYTISYEVLGQGPPMDPHATEGKAALDIAFQNLTAALDATGSCLFATFGIGGPELAEMLSALTGEEYSLEEFLRAGERIWNNERLWNLKVGYSAADDTLPKRLLEEPIKTGASRGEVNRLDEMLPEYYSLRGWDADGVPTQAKLEELAL
ncbi:aldehyde ferredoxin oxidoreductase family protein [Streptomyces cavernae]|uniref:aldehyde ferredoxin oxidoreductase family protein n=1 Tax=Streptomyces cavernae TaxID=2259034 RepID=UPI000FEB67F1|nr:aldehyde ferredoxin oxidoreductase family protein [Streptomyces cavernae]